MERGSFDFALLKNQNEIDHKKKPAQFESVASGVQKRMENKLKSLKRNRCSTFDSIRNLPASPARVSDSQQKLAHRLQQLARWKEEKEKNKKEALLKKKKPFLVGVPHTSHKYATLPVTHIKPVTRSQTAHKTKFKASSQSFAPENATFEPNLNKSKITCTFDPVPPKKTGKLVSNKEVKPSRTKAQITKTSNFNRQSSSDTKSVDAAKQSGTDNSRRETKKLLDEGLLDVDTADMDNIEHFRRQLASEIKRMTEMCQLWDQVLEQAELPEYVQEDILAAVGQCRLLMSKKLQQFASLVEQCARPEPGTALVTPADLHGFWNMVSIQIEDVNICFKKLEELRANNWRLEQKVVVVAKKKVVKSTKAKSTGGASMLKEMIAAIRKAQKSKLSAPATASPGEKSFEAGFFRVTTPIRTPAPATPRSKMPTLLKAVLSSEAKSASKSLATIHDRSGTEVTEPQPTETQNIFIRNFDLGVWSQIEREDEENLRGTPILIRQEAFDIPDTK